MTFTNGTYTTTATLAIPTGLDITADKFFSCWLFLHNMTATETFKFQCLVLDANAATMRTYRDFDLTGAQDPPAIFFAPIPAKQYQIKIQRTAGTDRAVTWLLSQTGTP
jgi:hypothetical protein